MVYGLVCQAKQEIMRSRNKFLPKSPEKSGPLSESHLCVEEGLQHKPQVHTLLMALLRDGSTPTAFWPLQTSMEFRSCGPWLISRPWFSGSASGELLF